MICLTVYQLPPKNFLGVPEMEFVEKRMAEICRAENPWWQEFAEFLQGGKRLRPALVLLCGSFGSPDRQALADTAAAAEFIHAASLIHDDIIDGSDTRRNRPTVFARWGTHRAVLYGDFLFARAFSLLSGCGYPGVLANMTRAISLMCDGEIHQYSRSFDITLTEADYFAYIHKKTAFFLSACCMAGAMIGGLGENLQGCLGSFGLQLGYAFQITDDLLDLCGTPQETGKPVLHDLTEGYLTLPVIRLLRHPFYGPEVARIIQERRFDAENLFRIKEMMVKAGVLADIQKKAHSLIQRARENLKHLPNKPAKAVLTKIAGAVLTRKR